MTSQVRGMSQGIRNANDGISMAQTAEGALNEVTNMLQRVRELTVQGVNGTYSDYRSVQHAGRNRRSSPRRSASVLTNTEFNGMKLFDAPRNDRRSDG